MAPKRKRVSVVRIEDDDDELEIGNNNNNSITPFVWHHADFEQQETSAKRPKLDKNQPPILFCLYTDLLQHVLSFLEKNDIFELEISCKTMLQQVFVCRQHHIALSLPNFSKQVFEQVVPVDEPISMQGRTRRFYFEQLPLAKQSSKSCTYCQQVVDFAGFFDHSKYYHFCATCTQYICSKCAYLHGVKQCNMCTRNYHKMCFVKAECTECSVVACSFCVKPCAMCNSTFCARCTPFMCDKPGCTNKICEDCSDGSQCECGELFCEQHCKTCESCLTRLCEGCYGDTLMPQCEDCIRENSEDDVIEIPSGDDSEDDDSEVEIAVPQVQEPWFLRRNARQ